MAKSSSSKHGAAKQRQRKVLNNITNDKSCLHGWHAARFSSFKTQLNNSGNVL
jgi:hypothetical protein